MGAAGAAGAAETGTTIPAKVPMNQKQLEWKQALEVNKRLIQLNQIIEECFTKQQDRWQQDYWKELMEYERLVLLDEIIEDLRQVQEWRKNVVAIQIKVDGANGKLRRATAVQSVLGSDEFNRVVHGGTSRRIDLAKAQELARAEGRDFLPLFEKWWSNALKSG